MSEPARHDMHLLPVVHDRESAFAYTCHGCGRCCYHKGIRVGPYTVARLAETLATTTTEVWDRYVDAETSTLRQRPDGACVFFDGGCSVHPGRPLACRVYPLGWTQKTDGSEAFLQVSPHPESAGVYGQGGTVADYIASQETAPYEAATQRYAGVLVRLRAALAFDGPEVGEMPPITDVDAAVRADCDARGVPVPDDVEARVDLHLALLHRWLDAAGAPASGDVAA
ncbi:MAG: YkgJ family cysteine cluster protein [Bacteroidota bacterium]